MSSAKTAEKCFVENRNLFGNPQSQPEKYNYYQGLANLAAAVEALHSDVRHVRQEIRALQDDVSRIKSGMRA